MGRFVDYVNTRPTPALVGTEKPLIRNAAGASIGGTTQDIADLKVETDPIVGAVTGLVKADGAGNISAATAGTDYLTTVPVDHTLFVDEASGSDVTGDRKSVV